jgi:predicted RNase H-like HicB family nuclease
MADYKYRISLAWSNEDNAWIAEVPELLGCAADGQTPSEATNNVLEAIDRWMRIAQEEGWDIPQPHPYNTPVSA